MFVASGVLPSAFRMFMASEVTVVLSLPLSASREEAMVIKVLL